MRRVARTKAQTPTSHATRQQECTRGSSELSPSDSHIRRLLLDCHGAMGCSGSAIFRSNSIAQAGCSASTPREGPPRTREGFSIQPCYNCYLKTPELSQSLPCIDCGPRSLMLTLLPSSPSLLVAPRRLTETIRATYFVHMLPHHPYDVEARLIPDSVDIPALFTEPLTSASDCTTSPRTACCTPTGPGLQEVASYCGGSLRTSWAY